MASAAPKIASLDRARFEKLVAAKCDAEARLSAAGEAVTQFCRQYSRAHGFGVNLTPDQVRRDLVSKARVEMEGEAA